MELDDDLLPISGLQHLVFCERQVALIHVERLWAENRLTAEGRIAHRAVDGLPSETRDGRRVVRGMELRSETLKLFGRADVVEFRSVGGRASNAAVAAAVRGSLAGAAVDLSGWRVVPIEHKRGRPKTHPVWGDCDRVQLCAQAIALEEMLSVEIPAGCLFYGQTRRRVDVALDDDLRRKTFGAARRLHEIIGSRITPPPVADRRCERCSLRTLCMPDVISRKRSAAKWTSDAVDRLLKETP